MQLFSDQGFEEEVTKGFGWIKGSVKKIKLNNKDLKLPHMGWNEVNVVKKNDLFLDIKNLSHFYFVHSYAFEAENINDKNKLLFGLITTESALENFDNNKTYISELTSIYAPVAQLDRVLGFEPRGQEFESLRARHFNKKLNKKYLKITQNEITKEQNIFLISNKI